MVGKTAIKDSSLKNTKFYSDNKNYNLKNKLLKDQKIDKSFLDKIRFITLEELITLKLLVSAEDLKGKLYNFPFLRYTSDICKEAVVRFALSLADNRKEASLILGMKKADFLQYIREYNLIEEFNYDSKTKNSK
jgi:hypothetical protein